MNNIVPDYKTMAEELWQLLDDIDTAGDMFKPDINPYFKYVNKKAQLRHNYLYSPDGYTLVTNDHN